MSSGVPSPIILATERERAHWPHFVPYWFAQERGFFVREGLPAVEMIDTGDYVRMLEELPKGSIHFGTDMRTDLVLQANSRGQDVYIIAGARNKSNHVLVAAKGIRSVEDLRGKAIGITRLQDLGHRHALRLLNEHGLKPGKDVAFVTVGAATSGLLVHKIAAGEVAAGFVGFESARQLAEQGHAWLLDLKSREPEYSDRVMVTTGTMIERYPEVVRGVIKGIIQGYQAERNRDDVRRLLQREGLLDEYFDSPYQTHMAMLALDGSITMAGLQVIIEEEKRLGTIPSSFDVAQVVRSEFLEQAQRELGLPVHI